MKGLLSKWMLIQSGMPRIFVFSFPLSFPLFSTFIEKWIQVCVRGADFCLLKFKGYCKIYGGGDGGHSGNFKAMK